MNASNKCLSVDGRVCCAEGVEWVLDRHTDADRADRSTGDEARTGVERIRCEWRRCQAAIPEGAGIFEVSKELQPFIADVTTNRAVEVFAINRHNRRC